MSTQTWKRFLPALALLLATAAPGAHAQHRQWLLEPQSFAPRIVADRRISIEQAIAQVQRQTGGRVLDARDEGNRYRIKILTRKGEVLVVYVDARTGETR